MKKNIYELIIAFVIFVVTTLIMFWSQLSGDSFFWEDFVEQVYPLQNFAAVESSNVVTPYWNPYTFSGMPFIADPQVGYYYPFNRLMNLFVSDGVLSPHVVQIIIILHFLIALIAFYFMAKNFKISHWGSTIGAVGYAFSMIFICHAFHPMMIYHFAWFPLALMFFDKGLKKRSIYYGLISALFLAMIFLSGHPQTTLYLVLFLFFYFVWDFISTLKNKEFLKPAHIINYLLTALIAVVISAGIYMIQYLPSEEMVKYSARSEENYEKSTEGSLEIKQVFQTVFPQLFGSVNGANTPEIQFHLANDGKQSPYYYYWDTAFYFGLALLILGLVAIFGNIKNRMTAFFLFIAVFGFAYALGDNFFIHTLFYNFPMFGKFRMPARILIFAVIAFGVLAGMGYDYLLSDIDRSKKTKILIISTSIPFLIALLNVTGVLSNIVETPPNFIESITDQSSRVIFIILITFISSYILIRNPKSTTIIGLILTIILFVDLYLVGNDFNKGFDNPADLYRLDAQMETTYKAVPPYNIFRINTRIPQYGVMTMKRNQGMVSRIMTIEGYNPLNLERRMPPIKDVSLAYDILNTKYQVIANIETQTINYIEKPNRLPHIWLCSDYKILGENEFATALTDTNINLHSTALLEKNPNINITFSDKPSKVKCTKYTSNEIVATVSSQKNGILMFNEIWYPAWKVYIDGKETELLRTNWSLRGVALLKGDHTIVMKYESDAFKTGRVISLISLLIAVFGIVYFGFINYKKRGNNG